MTKVIIARGLPGSGKDTFLRSLEWGSQRTFSICGADDYFMVDGEYRFDITKLSEAHDACFAKFVELCNDNTTGTVAVSNTNAQIFEMAPYMMYARLRKLPVEIFEVILGQTNQPLYLELQGRNVHGAMDQEIGEMAALWESAPDFWPKPVEVQSLDKAFRIFDSEGFITETIPAVTEG